MLIPFDPTKAANAAKQYAFNNPRPWYTGWRPWVIGLIVTAATAGGLTGLSQCSPADPPVASQPADQ
jgi:hypothetical protein